MKRLNLKGLVIVSVAGLLLAGATFGIYQVQSRRNAEKLLAQVQQAEADAEAEAQAKAESKASASDPEDNPAAVDSNAVAEALAQAEEGDADAKTRTAKILERYLKYRPEDEDAQARYGLLLADLANSPQTFEAALLVLERALLGDPSRDDLRRRAMDTALVLQRFPRVSEHANAILATHPEDGPATLALARVAENDEKPDVAAALYQKAIERDPSLIEAYTRLANLARNLLNDPDRADQAVDLMVANNPDSAIALRLRAEYQLGVNTSEQISETAAQDATKALELAPDDPTVARVAAAVDIRRGDLDSARTRLEAALEKSPRDGDLYRELAEVEILANQYAALEHVLARGVAARPSDLELKSMLAETRIILGNVEGGEELLDDLARRSFDKTTTTLLRARLLMSQGDYAAAAPLLEEVIPLVVGDRQQTQQTGLMLATCYARLGQTDRQLTTYRRIIEEDPSAVQARLQLAMALETEGDLDGALLQYRFLAANSPEASLAVVWVLARKALSQPEGERDWAEVDAALDAAGRALPDDPRVPLLRADVLFARDRGGEVRQVLETARDAHPERIELWAALVELARREDRPQDVAPLLDAAQRALGDTIALRSLRARAAIAEGGPDASAHLAALAEGLDGFEDQDRRNLIRGLALGRSQVGDPQGALALWAPVAAEQPTELDAQLFVFDLAVDADDRTAQDAALAQIKAIQGDDGAEYRYGLARQQIEAAREPGSDRSSLAETRALLAQVAGQRPDWPQVSLSMAQVAEIDGDNEAALTHYLHAIDLGANDPAVFRRTLQLLAEAGRHDEADQVMAQLRNNATLAGEADRLASQAFAGADDTGRAIELAEQIVADGSTDYRDHLWLGQLLQSANRQNEAEAPLRRAVELAGDNPAPLFALIGFLNTSGRADDAAQIVASAETTTFTPEKSPLVLARAVELIGQTERAAALYDQAIAAQPDDNATRRAYFGSLVRRGDNHQAITYLETLVPPTGEIPPELGWAREALALQLASSGLEDGSRRALELLGLGSESTSAAADQPIDRLRAQARVLAMQPDEARRGQAISLLEEITRRAPSLGEDRLLLAQLYEFTKDWAKADATMKSLLAANPREARYRIEYIQALLRNDRAGEAEPWLTQLEEIQPGAARNAQLRAQVLVAQGKAEEGVALLRTLAEENADLLRPVALALENMDQTEAAEQLYRKYVETSDPSADPQAILVLAEFLGRQGRTKEALDLCQTAARTNPPNVIANTCTTILLAHPDEAQAQRVEGWIRAMLDRSPQDPELRTGLAIVRNLQGQVPEAIAIYEELLAANPDNIVALNNLSMLLVQTGGDPAKALELINHAINAGGPLPALLDTRALVHLAANRLEPATRDLEHALATGPLASMYFHLAQVYARANRPDDARAALEDGKRRGLATETLEPAERPAYAQLANALGLE